MGYVNCYPFFLATREAISQGNTSIKQSTVKSTLIKTVLYKNVIYRVIQKLIVAKTSYGPALKGLVGERWAAIGPLSVNSR
jgi:hypothetical protein